MDKNTEELNRLYRLLYERDAQVEKAKLRRTILTILGFAAFYFWVSVKIIDAPGDLSLQGIAVSVVVSVVLGGIHFWINATIFSTLFQKGKEENDMLDAIRKRISELENTTTERW